MKSVKSAYDHAGRRNVIISVNKLKSLMSFFAATSLIVWTIIETLQIRIGNTKVFTSNELFESSDFYISTFLAFVIIFISISFILNIDRISNKLIRMVVIGMFCLCSIAYVGMSFSKAIYYSQLVQVVLLIGGISAGVGLLFDRLHNKLRNIRE
jgi:hypothetical protein